MKDEAVVCMLLCCCLSELNWVLLELKRGFIHGFGLICAFKAATIFILKPRSSSSFDIESFFYHIFARLQAPLQRSEIQGSTQNAAS